MKNRQKYKRPFERAFFSTSDILDFRHQKNKGDAVRKEEKSMNSTGLGKHILITLALFAAIFFLAGIAA